jgi:hypothetical protein
MEMMVATFLVGIIDMRGGWDLLAIDGVERKRIGKEGELEDVGGVLLCDARCRRVEGG